MAITQLSILLGNKPGALAEICCLLYRNEIDIRALSVYDTAEFCVLRMVVDQPEKALPLLVEGGHAAKAGPVLTINPEDHPGSLCAVFSLLGKEGVNVEYVYSFVSRKNESQYFVLKVGNPQKAASILQQAGVKVVDSL